MDIVLVMLLFVYIAQGILLFLNHFLEYRKLLWLFMAGFVALILFLTSKTLFILILVFYMIFFSRTCRLSDYGFSYHFTFVVAIGLTYGPLAGIIMGLLPRLLIPKIRPDIQIIDILTGSVLLTLVGIVSGVVGYFSHEIFVPAAIIILVIYNLSRFLTLYGKLPMVKVSVPFFLNIGLNYYLITFYLIKLMTLMGYVVPT